MLYPDWDKSQLIMNKSNSSNPVIQRYTIKQKGYILVHTASCDGCPNVLLNGKLISAGWGYGYSYFNYDICFVPVKTGDEIYACIDTRFSRVNGEWTVYFIPIKR